MRPDPISIYLVSNGNKPCMIHYLLLFSLIYAMLMFAGFFLSLYTHTHTVYQSIDFIVMNTVIFTVCHYKIIKETEGESLQDDSMKGVSR